MYVHLELADTIIHAEYRREQIENVEKGVYEQGELKWHCVLVDTFGAKRDEMLLTNEQFNMMVILSLGAGEDKIIDDASIAKMYEVCEEILLGCSVRPIP